jgi:hypothetical protein
MNVTHPDCFTHEQRTFSTSWIGGWLGSKAALDEIVKRTIQVFQESKVHLVVGRFFGTILAISSLFLYSSAVCSCRRGETVSELRPPTGLLFIPQVIYEHGEPWWNYTDREKPKKSEKNLSQCHKSHVDRPGREPRPPQ